MKLWTFFNDTVLKEEKSLDNSHELLDINLSHYGEAKIQQIFKMQDTKIQIDTYRNNIKCNVYKDSQISGIRDKIKVLETRFSRQRDVYGELLSNKRDKGKVSTI